MSIYSGCVHSTYTSGNRRISDCRVMGTNTLKPFPVTAFQPWKHYWDDSFADKPLDASNVFIIGLSWVLSGIWRTVFLVEVLFQLFSCSHPSLWRLYILCSFEDQQTWIRNLDKWFSAGFNLQTPTYFPSENRSWHHTERPADERQ